MEVHFLLLRICFIYLVTALDFIVGALQQSQLANAAATALHNICCVSKYKLKDNFAPLMQIIRSLQRLNLDNEHNISLIGGKCKLLKQRCYSNVIGISNIQ